jgi:hypothetical protein
MSRYNRNSETRRLAEQILGIVMQSFSEYSFVHTPEQLHQLITEPETDPVFLQEVREDILDILEQNSSE